MAADDMAERFARETAKHEMTVLHDDGLYRHLRFQQPGTGMYWFELVTWPGKLAFAGDVDGYAFSCTTDMLGFFRQSSWQGGINPTYWDEKVIASRDSVMTYSQDLFNKQVADDLKEAEQDWPGVTEAWNEKVNGFLSEYNTEYEHDARAALNENEFEYLPEGGTGEPFRFQDAWEWQLKDHDWSFLWCCHAIVWGISQYDSARAASKPEADTEPGQNEVPAEPPLSAADAARADLAKEALAVLRSKLAGQAATS